MADKMQDDAMQRYRQMYSKAQQNSPEIRNTPPVENTEENKEQKPLVHNEHQNVKKSENVLDLFMKDKEKSLIVLLIVILLSEKADTTLILALMYLII